MSQYPNSITIPLFENYCRKNQVDGVSIDCKIGEKPVKLKVASTPKSQLKGYMGAKESPKGNEGILFVYDEEMPLYFWMKDVPFPLDIIFFDSNMDYVGHATMEPYKGEKEKDLPSYSSEKPARFAVELPAGWCESNLTHNSKLIM